MNVQVIDTETCNLKSLSNALKFLEIQFSIISEPRHVKNATHVILPGVGAFDAVMRKLTSNGLSDALQDKMSRKNTRILGICLGMQILGEYSDEGEGSFCLGVIHANIGKLPASSSFKIPHVGLNSVEHVAHSALFKGIPNNSNFYFVHSYAMEVTNAPSMVGKTSHGVYFCSVIDNKEGIFGVQFHPEKSRMNGIKLLQNFLEKD